MSSPASIAKHPIHPMLVVFPIGLWVFSLVCDVIYRISHNLVWETVALYCIGGGIVGALLAAIPGFIDFLGLNDPRAKKIATYHMILNLTGVLLFAINFWLRLSDPTGSIPFILSVVTIIAAAISGWLGGELVYVHGVGVDQRGTQQSLRKAG